MFKNYYHFYIRNFTAMNGSRIEMKSLLNLN